MDNERQDLHNPDTDTGRNNEIDRCAYCGAKLNPHYYFCSRCATPYKKIAPLLSPPVKKKFSDREVIKRKAPYVTPLFWTYFAVILVSAILTYTLFQDEENSFHFIFSSVTISLFTLTAALRFRHSLKNQFHFSGLFNKYFPIGIAALGLLLVINYFYHTFIYWLINGEWIQPYEFSSMNISLQYLLICLLPAVGEEIAFRGLLQRWLTSALGTHKAALLVSTLFAGLHFSVISFPYLFTLGILFFWVKKRTKSLIPVMILHFLHNFIVLSFF